MTKLHLCAVNLHNWRPSSISTSKISHVTENGDWLGVQTEGDKLTDIRPIDINNDASNDIIFTLYEVNAIQKVKKLTGLFGYYSKGILGVNKLLAFFLLAPVFWILTYYAHCLSL